MPGFLRFQGGPQESTDALNQVLNVGWSFAEKLSLLEERTKEMLEPTFQKGY